MLRLKTRIIQLGGIYPRFRTHRKEPVVELAVTSGDSNVRDFVRCVVVMRGEVEISEVWRRR